ncbi:GTP-binding protein [Nocardia otitidiscaviarum]|uniref:GTP-binding protein n=1 Tax=Nocardia otitidiscaviarum TaxID=1823 RepID=UPI000B284A45|nr:GTP-binding protein [Nocardia otitidiscaviarum]
MGPDWDAGHPRVDLEYRIAMGTKAIDPQAIRNVTVMGHPDETARVVHRLSRHLDKVGAGTPVAFRWTADGVDHTIRLAELSSHTPIPGMERAIRLADGVVAVVNAASNRPARLETMLRVADDHQIARLCLVIGLDQPGADFDRCVRAVADTRGAAPLPLQMPIGIDTEFAGAIDLVAMVTYEAADREPHEVQAVLAEQKRHRLLATVLGRPALPNPRTVSTERVHHLIRYRTRIGDVVPMLCSVAPRRIDDVAPLLDALVRYLPSPMDVCQPTHVLDY